MERSCLYSIEPIGIGTINVESLSSYISRLADAHCVTVGDIMTHLIAPKIDKKYIKGGNGFYKSSSAINGHGNIADNFIELIAFLTQRRDIEKTTFVNCRELVPFRGLLKSSRHWCPSCFQADLESKQIVYERLSWTLQPFLKCIIHDSTLESVCPFCKSSMYILERKSVPGYCSKCFYWLGNFKESQIMIINDGEDNDSMRTFFSTFINLSFGNDCVSRSISFYLEKNFEGFLTKAAVFFGYPKSTLWGWKEGTNLPPLNALIKITIKSQLSLTDFFNMEKSIITLKNNDCSDRKISSGRVKKDHKKIRNFLKLIIVEKRSYSLSEIANLMECDRKLLTQMYPNECQQIKMNYLDSLEVKKQFKNNTIELTGQHSCLKDVRGLERKGAL
ncbi:TniQ family protein [Lysinibacillus sp. CNPSo 3705]|uniref:TniQ family protein n=1 Tax=Lysinibacillus sp. CNPSo 3705 TaxID=3028148 RepID=UPI0023649BAC|nr:TniQ family protein [Lysinibacillus sp. CNPSo 3705]MDD1505820.1 TniQ family protein [Lysinibacillus sp. CNPSo 3705]